MQERRKYPRLVRPLDGTWHGQSGASPCRITDISWGGCFVQTLSTPSADESTVVILPLEDGQLELQGHILYVERDMGFAMQFERLTPHQIQTLATLLGEPPESIR